MAASSSAAAINLQLVQEESKRELMGVLASMTGKKTLVIDPQLLGPLNKVADMPMMKENNVESLIALGPEPVPVERNILYLVRPRMELMSQIAGHIHAHAQEASAQTCSYAVYFVPRRTLICERILEEEGVIGSVILGEFNLNFIPFEEDVLSMELEHSFRECFLEGDRTSLYYVARGLVSLQNIFGVIPTIQVKGSCAQHVYELMCRMRKELNHDVYSGESEVDSLLLFDRTADIASPMITQLTYEGLIDEIFGINYGQVEAEVDVSTPVGDPDGGGPGGGSSSSGSRYVMEKRVKKIALSNKDRVFAEIRNRNFVAVGDVLNKKACYINEGYESRKNLSISEIREFMKRLPQLQEEHLSLGYHINIAQKINEVTKEQDFAQNLTIEQDILMGENEKGVLDYIEELINRQDKLSRVLRLLCLWSCVGNGLKAKTYDFFRKEIMQTYGYESILTLYNLEKLGMLKKQEGRSPWSNIRTKMRLIVDQRDDQNPVDISFVCSGYAPLSCRIVEAISRQGFQAMHDLLALLPGEQEEYRQSLPPSIVRSGEAMGGGAARRKRRVLVMFIGGVTFAEISALRFLSETTSTEYLVATTKLVSGSSLLNSLYEDVGKMSTRG